MIQRPATERFVARCKDGGRRRCALARNSAKGLSSERVHFLSSCESCIVDYPQSAVLLPWKVAQEMILRIDVVTESFGTEEGVDIATVWKLAEYLRKQVQQKQQQKDVKIRVIKGTI